MPPKKTVTKKRNARICADYNAGLPQWALLTKYGLTWASICPILKEGGVEYRWKRYPKIQKILGTDGSEWWDANKQTVNSELKKTA